MFAKTAVKELKKHLPSNFTDDFFSFGHLPTDLTLTNPATSWRIMKGLNSWGILS